MSKLLFCLLALIPVMLFAQPDSTEINFKYIDNPDLQLIYSMSDIQLVKLQSNDKCLEVKVFNLIIKEFKKGKIVHESNLDLRNEEQLIPIEVNGKQLVQSLNDFDCAGFKPTIDSLQIRLYGQLKRGIFKLNIEYPGCVFFKELKGKRDYRLRRISSASNKNSVSL